MNNNAICFTEIWYSKDTRLLMAFAHENGEWSAEVISIDDSAMPPPWNEKLKGRTLNQVKSGLKRAGLRCGNYSRGSNEKTTDELCWQDQDG